MAASTSLPGIVERLHSSPPKASGQLFREFVAQVRAAIRDGQHKEAADALRQAIEPSLDYTSLQSLYRLYRSLPCSPFGQHKVAVLGGSTTSKLAAAIELAVFSMGARVEVVEGDYGVYRQDILDASSSLYAHKPNTIFLATTWRDLINRPALTDTAEQVQALVEAELAHWKLLWQTAHDRLGCQIIQNNFDRPAWRQLGNHEVRHPAGLARYIGLLNQALADQLPPYVVLHDLDELAASAGRARWGDERLYYHAKMPCPPECLVEYGFNVSSLLAAQLGLTKKCLVLDLDNTLWGGVIGDDGLGGIRLGQGDGEGEAFLAFQRYAKALKDRGVLLAVCSKNTEQIAKEVFLKHPEMVLRLDDISCFMANWNDKASNLREIARRLNIGVNALVFVDDNPAERALVRQLTPEVAVPELPADPADYILAVERHRYFQITSLANEDLQRAEYYRANAEREQMLGDSADVGNFLQSLQMVARVAPVDQLSLERTAQLINKSNQFNLTTRRRTAAEVLTLANQPDWLACTLSLRDCFGDNGLISVLLARREDDVLVIDTWLMSCRVLKRGVETFLHNYLCGWALEAGLGRIRGEYIPTAKNGIVKDHYGSLGFELLGAEADGRTLWEYPIPQDWIPEPTYIYEESLLVTERRVTPQAA